MGDDGNSIGRCTASYLCLDRLPRWLIVFITLVLPFLAMGVVALSPLDLEPPIKYTLAVFVCVSMLWTFGSLPLAVTALLVPILLTLFGLTTVAGALQPFGDPVVFLRTGGLIIAEAFRVNGLDRRIAFYLVNAADGDVRRTFLALMAVSALLSMWISNTATVALLVPVVLSIAARAEGDGRRIAGLFLIGICISTAFGSMATIVGTPVNAIASGLLTNVVPWTFLDWIKIGLVVSVVLLALTYLLLPRILPASSRGIDVAPIRNELKEMGKLSGKEKRVLAVFFPTIVLWVFGGNIADAIGLPSGFLSAAIVSLMAAFVLFAVRAMEWQQARLISWDIFLIIGAGLALGEALEITGTAAWMAMQISSLTGGQSLLVIMLFVGAMTLVVTTFLSNTATVAILVPIVISVSAGLGTDPRYLVLVTAFCASISFITPVGTPPVTIAYATGKFNRTELAKAGLLIGIPAMLLVVFLVYGLISIGWI